jgi:IclR family acetate operon transcriptional repressor
VATIDKALTLLSCFTPEQPSMKLTDLARLSGMNKAGVFRYLSGLSRAGLIEQDEETRHYRLGPEIVRLAQVRDATVPIRRWMREILSEITERTGETCHAGLTAQGRLFAYMVNDSPKSLQVRIDPGMDLPFHATASGQIFLAFAPDHTVEATLDASLPSFTRNTITDPQHLKSRLQTFRDRGYSVSEGGVDTDVISVATAFFDAGGQPVGTIAIQAPAARMTDERIRSHGALLCLISAEATRQYGGLMPANFPETVPDDAFGPHRQART